MQPTHSTDAQQALSDASTSLGASACIPSVYARRDAARRRDGRHGRPKGRPLGSPTDKSGDPDGVGLSAERLPDLARYRRWTSRRIARALPSEGLDQWSERVADCGCHRVPGMAVQLMRYDGGKGAAAVNVQRCGRDGCPACTATSRRDSAETLALWTRRRVRDGYAVWFVTLTVRHNLSHTLEETGRRLDTAWRYWRDRMQREVSWWRAAEWYSAIEVTRTRKNGWHPHIHIAVLVPPDHRPRYRDIRRETWTRWKAATDGFPSEHRPTSSDGVDVRRWESDGDDQGQGAAWYVWGLAGEIHGAKRGKKGRTPVELLDRKSDWKHWVEYMRWRYKRRCFRKSSGLGALAKGWAPIERALWGEAEAESTAEPVGVVSPGVLVEAEKRGEHDSLMKATRDGRSALRQWWRKRRDDYPPIAGDLHAWTATEIELYRAPPGIERVEWSDGRTTEHPANDLDKYYCADLVRRFLQRGASALPVDNWDRESRRETVAAFSAYAARIRLHPVLQPNAPPRWRWHELVWRTFERVRKPRQRQPYTTLYNP